MKSYDSRANGISDFVEWDESGQLQLSPKFQRRNVWSPKAKSYLMDTIVRGKPIPKIFIRQILNVTTRSSVREVVDGQQRLRTILSFIQDGFTISKSHNKEYGGLFFSQLSPEVQAQVLSYEISVDLLINLPDAEILDIFGRLNSYAVVLNEQEKLNAKYFGPFKGLADEIGRYHNEYWIDQKIFTPKEVLRMAEVNLTADLLISMLEGIKAKRQISRYYNNYENSFDHNTDQLKESFSRVISVIADLFPGGLRGSEFNRPFLFYTLFTSVAHSLFRLPNFDYKFAFLLSRSGLAAARNNLERIVELFAKNRVLILDRGERDFLRDSTRATTDEAVRVRRTKYIIDLMAGEDVSDPSAS